MCNLSCQIQDVPEPVWVDGNQALERIGGEFQVNSYYYNDQRYPVIKGLINSSFVAVWSSYLQDGDSLGVYGQLHDGMGNRIVAEFQVNTYTVGSQKNPSVASLINGNFVVTWESDRQDGDQYGVYGQMCDSGGNRIGGEFQVNTHNYRHQEMSSASGLINGDFVVIWQSDGQDSDGYGIYAQRYDENGSRLGSEFQVNTHIILKQRTPSVVGLANGGFVVTWESEEQDGDSEGVYAQIYDGIGNKINKEFQVNSHTLDTQKHAKIAALSNGNFAVIWVSRAQNGPDWGIYGQIFDSIGNKLGGELQMHSSATESNSYPSIAALSDGNFIVTWGDHPQGADSTNVYAQVYNSSGNTVGSEFQVNTHMQDSQRYPSVAALPNGKFAITWQSDDQDGDDKGVYAQLYNLVHLD